MTTASISGSCSGCRLRRQGLLCQPYPGLARSPAEQSRTAPLRSGATSGALGCSAGLWGYSDFRFLILDFRSCLLLPQYVKNIKIALTISAFAGTTI